MKNCIRGIACKSGNIKLPLSEFYKHIGMTDGHLNKCKKCCKSESKEREEKLKINPEWVEKEKDRGREKYHRLYNDGRRRPTKEKQRQSTLNYRAKYPEKHKANGSAQGIKPKIKGNQLHHWSYNTEHFKDIIELSKKDHATAHRFLIYDQERKMYRTTQNILLDTKQVHIDYIQQFL